MKTDKQNTPAPVAKKKKPVLTLGPLLFHWSEEERRDFYLRVADEMDVDEVYVGEVVCSKRERLFAHDQQKVIQRLQNAGKKIVIASLAMVTAPHEIDSIKEKAQSGFLVEANDVAAVQVLAGKPFVVGPFINVMNEGTRDYMKSLGATRLVVASELSLASIGALASPDVETEVQVFGRQPLAVAMRCYAARAQGRNKDGCRFACGLDPDGLPVQAYDGTPVLTVNGTMTMSHGYVVLLQELERLKAAGISRFRLSPQRADMIAIAYLYRAVLTGKKDPESALADLKKKVGQVPFINGFLHAKEGLAWIGERMARRRNEKKARC